MTGEYTDGDGIRVTVEDEGPRIPLGNLGSISKHFYSERPHSDVFDHRSGRGLEILKQIVEAHGGKIQAENVTHPADPDIRRGTRFIFELPA